MAGSGGVAPVERRVMTVVAAAVVVPGQTERMDMTAHRVREDEAVVHGVTGVLDRHRFGVAGIDAHHPFSAHQHEPTGHCRPLHPGTVYSDRRAFDTKRLADE